MRSNMFFTFHVYVLYKYFSTYSKKTFENESVRIFLIKKGIKIFNRQYAKLQITPINRYFPPTAKVCGRKFTCNLRCLLSEIADELQ